MNRMQNSWKLAKASWEVLTHDKELMVLPIMSAVASLVVAATFVVPLFSTGSLNTDGDIGGLTYVLLFTMYVALAYVTIFFNAALVSAAHERLGGGDPTLRSALAGAAGRAGKILPWAIVSATVSIILRAIEERAGAIGRLVSAIAGMAWAVVTFLVLPIIVIENLGVADAVRKSGALFKRTWGENLAAQAGFGLFGLLAMLPGVALLAIAASAGGAALAVAIVAGISWIILVAVVMTAISGIFQTALYHFAVDGSVPADYFSDETMRGAFVTKHPRSGGFGFGGG